MFLQVVEKGDLIGLDFLWEVCLHIPDESIADSAIQLLLNMSYNNLNSRLKKVRCSHSDFIYIFSTPFLDSMSITLASF